MGFILKIEKAKEIFISNMRRIREDEFAKLDVQYMRALELDESTTEIVAKKQQLRDLPNMDLSDVTNLTQLKAKWPTNLLGSSPF